MRALTTGALCTLSLTVSMSLAPPAWSQEKVGVATTVVGPVTVTRAALPAAPLKFKDDIFLRDRVTTGDDAITRILLGGKVIVTARERSTLVITEVPGLTTIDLTSGRIAVAVDKTRMKSGERVEVRTPNAIAGVRGTVFIVEAQPNISTVTVLRGLVDVSRLDPNAHVAIGPVTPVAKHHTITVRNNVLPARPKAITPAQADALSREFSPPMRQVAVGAVMPLQEEIDRAVALLNALVAPTQESSDRTATASGLTSAEGAENPPATTGGNTPVAGVAPLVPTTSTPASSAGSTTATAASAVTPVTTTAASGVAPVTAAVAPVTSAVAPALAPVTTTLAPVTTAVAPVLAPVTTTLTPVTTTLAPVVAPVTSTLAPVVAPITTTLAPVVAPITTTLAPVVAPITTTLAPALAPITAPLAPALAPITAPLAPALTPVSSLPTTTVPTAPLAPPPPTSSGGLLGGLLKPVTGLLK